MMTCRLVATLAFYGIVVPKIAIKSDKIVLKFYLGKKEPPLQIFRNFSEKRIPCEVNRNFGEFCLPRERFCSIWLPTRNLGNFCSVECKCIINVNLIYRCHALNYTSTRGYLVYRRTTKTKETNIANKHGGPVGYLQSVTKDMNSGLPRKNPVSGRVEALNSGSPASAQNCSAKFSTFPSCSQMPVMFYHSVIQRTA